MDVPSELNNSLINVLAKRSVNIPHSSAVTNSPLMFPNKPEKSHPNSNSFFSANTKTKVGSPSITASKPPSKVTQVIAGTPQGKPSTGANQVDLEASFAFPPDEWDDFDDFETPVKGKTSGLCPETSVRADKSLSYKDDELKKTLHKDAECSSTSAAPATNKTGYVSEQSGSKTSSEPDVPRDTDSPDLWGPEESPVKITRRRRRHTPVLSDGEEEKVVEVKPVPELKGNYYHHISCYTVYAYCQAPTLCLWKAHTL